MSKVDGMVVDGFETIRDAFAEAQVQDEGGAQLCVYRHGKRVVDLWTGRDKVNDRPYTADTISIVMSCGKGVTATCAHMLVERGLLDPDAPVAHYWPQFAANGKMKQSVHTCTMNFAFPTRQSCRGYTTQHENAVFSRVAQLC